MKLYRTYETDLTAEVEGVWVELPDDAKVKIARWNNEKHDAILSALKHPHKDQIRAGIPLEKHVMVEIVAKAMAEAILLDWSGFKDDEGNELKYSKDECFSALLNLHDFRDDICSIASNRASYNKFALDSTKKS